jgi:DNA-binding NarL/FixJ family response regulator
VSVRVFHGDDSDAFRLLIAETLPDEGGIEVVGGARTDGEVVDGVARLRPDAVLLDQIGGVELLARVREAVPGVRIVILSGFPPGGRGAEALEAAADGYVVKTASTAEIAAAVRGG